MAAWTIHPPFVMLNPGSHAYRSPWAVEVRNLVNRVIPGKKLARTLLVANERTRQALPSCITGEVIEIAENGVDLSLWSVEQKASLRQTPCFLFIGRLVDWKRVDIALEALTRVAGAQLTIIGDGPMRSAWTRLAVQLNVANRVTFLGWLPQADCARHLQSATALLLPSVYECGGAVVLEAMATGTPVIATAWGGPQDYIDPNCGVLVPAGDLPVMVQGFADAMERLVTDLDRCRELGLFGRKKVERHFDWEDKVDRMLAIYENSILPREASSHPGDARRKPKTPAGGAVIALQQEHPAFFRRLGNSRPHSGKAVP